MDPNCPAQATEEVQDTVEAFRGGKCELSNLYACMHECEIKDFGTSFPTSEHHYQFKKLKAHDKGEEAFELLIKEDSFKAMKKVKECLPKSEVSESWKQSAVDEMKATCKLKYQSCVHACTALLNSWITLAEATGNPFWGTGLNVAQTLECIPDYWPGSNHMGKTLIDIWAELQ